MLDDSAADEQIFMLPGILQIPGTKLGKITNYNDVQRETPERFGGFCGLYCDAKKF